jgi:uncharacterized protein (DUF2461 family)
MWHPDPARLAAWRRTVDTDTKTVRAAIDDPQFKATFGNITGDRLARMPKGFPADHPAADLLKYKDVTFGRPMSDGEVFSPDLPDLLAETFAAAIPVLRLLARLAPDDAGANWLRG